MLTNRAYQKIYKAIANLDYDFEQFTIEAFITHIAKVRKKDILVNPWPFLGDLTGVWIPRKSADYIFYSTSAHHVLRNHIVLHEIGHMLLNHRRHKLSEILPLEEWLELQETEVFVEFRGLGYDAPSEREAEFFVHSLQKKVTKACRLNYLIGESSSLSEVAVVMKGLGYDE